MTPPSLGLGVETAAGGALPARSARGAGDMGEWVGALAPLCTPQALAAGPRRLFLEMVAGKVGDEAAGDAAGPLAVDAAVRGVEDGRLATGAGDGDISEAPLFFEGREPPLVERPLRGEDPFSPPGMED